MPSERVNLLTSVDGLDREANRRRPKQVFIQTVAAILFVGLLVTTIVVLKTALTKKKTSGEVKSARADIVSNGSAIDYDALSVTANLDCTGSHRYSARGTGYYPDSSPIEGGYVDMRGRPLHTLQDFLDGISSIVDVAMDNRAGIAYDTPVCIPELNHKYHRVIDIRVRDTGSAFYGKGHSRIDICVRNEAASFDNTINGHLTLVFH